MSTITSKKTKTVVLNNQIKVDDTIVRMQEVRINSDNPDEMTIAAYFASGPEVMDLYKDNRTSIREQEDSFEDMAFSEQEKIKSESI